MLCFCDVPCRNIIINNFNNQSPWERIRYMIMNRNGICQCTFLLKWNRRHLKKILILGCGLGIALIIINADELFKNTKSLESVNNMNGLKPRIWMEIMALRMEKRRKRLREHCEILKLNIRGNDSLHRPNEWEFLINRPFRLVWCNVFKAASTSWMYNFNILAGYKADFLQQTKEVPLQLARKKYPRPTLQSLEAALNDSTSFLIVRHPFERLLSGYRDKIEYAIPNSYHYKLGNYIVTKYRKKSSNKTKMSSILEYFKIKQRRPTFDEFVEFIVNLYKSGKPMDMHWTPITNFCTPCQVRFDVIMKFETLQDDQNYLIQRKKLQNWIKPQWKNPAKGLKNEMINLIEKYYAQLHSSQIYQLYNMYRYDFYLFEYKMDNYLKYVNSNEPESLIN